MRPTYVLVLAKLVSLADESAQRQATRGAPCRPTRPRALAQRVSSLPQAQRRTCSSSTQKLPSRKLSKTIVRTVSKVPRPGQACLLAEVLLTQPLITGKPERKQWLAMISLSLISFVVSLDATILVTALPVRRPLQPQCSADALNTGDVPLAPWISR